MGSEKETALALRSTGCLATPGIPDPGSPEFERTASHMAREFTEATTEIARLIRALNVQTERLDTAFRTEPDHYSRFGIDLGYDGQRRIELGDMQKAMERRAWEVLVDTLGIKNVMSVAKRTMFDEQLKSGELPPVSEQTILATLIGLTDQAKDFAKEAAREVFDMLRPRGHWGGQYATNNAFRVGRRVILTWKVEQGYSGGFRVNYGCEQTLTAIDGVFHLLAGRGVMRENKGPLVAAINASGKTGRGETEFFRFRCFKNRNLHLEFRRLDLVLQLNGLAAGEYVLGEDVE